MPTTDATALDQALAERDSPCECRHPEPLRPVQWARRDRVRLRIRPL